MKRIRENACIQKIDLSTYHLGTVTGVDVQWSVSETCVLVYGQGIQ